jgi:hypothetical protein
MKHDKIKSVLIYLTRYGRIDYITAYSHFNVNGSYLPRIIHKLRDRGLKIDTEQDKKGTYYKIEK